MDYQPYKVIPKIPCQQHVMSFTIPFMNVGQ